MKIKTRVKQPKKVGVKDNLPYRGIRVNIRMERLLDSRLHYRMFNYLTQI